MDIVKELGKKAFASRIKSLSDGLMSDMLKIYKEQDYDFEPRWFSLFQLIMKRKRISITEIARELNQSHPAVVQVVNVLEKKKLIISKKDSKDSRKRLISLSSKGHKLADDLAPLWEDVFMATSEMLQENAPDFFKQIENIENALTEESMYKRIKEKNKLRVIDTAGFIPYKNQFLQQFQTLNYNWLNEYLEVTKHDTRVISDPQKEIINQGGAAILYVSGNTVVGSYALQKVNDSDCELSKFTIKKEYRGRKLGKMMLDHAIEKAKQMGFKSMVLFTHEKLIEATSLYKNNGFQVITDPSPLADKTGRCSLFMQLSLTKNL